MAYVPATFILAGLIWFARVPVDSQYVPDILPQMLLLGMRDLLGGLLLGRNGTTVDIQLNRREDLEESLHNMRINRIAWNMLANRHAIFLTQEIAEITSATFVLNHQFVSTFSAVNHPMQQGCSWSGQPESR